jgi:hypothetical protein
VLLLLLLLVDFSKDCSIDCSEDCSKDRSKDSLKGSSMLMYLPFPACSGAMWVQLARINPAVCSSSWCMKATMSVVANAPSIHDDDDDDEDDEDEDDDDDEDDDGA